MNNNERGAVPVILIYAILVSMCMGGLSGLAVYLASDSVASMLLSATMALVLIFSIPVLPTMLKAINRLRRSISKWHKDVLKEM